MNTKLIKNNKAVILAALILLAALVGCSAHSGYIGHGVITNIELSKKNFKIVRSITGKATAEYIFGFGPDEQNLFDQARKDMAKKAGLVGSSKAVINLTTDIKIGNLFPVWFEKTVYVSGEVVEFY